MGFASAAGDPPHWAFDGGATEPGRGRYRTRRNPETLLVDDMVNAYANWRDSCRAVHATYRRWAPGRGPAGEAAFRRYTEALEAEQRAAKVYENFVWRVSTLGVSDYDLLENS